MYTHKSKVIKVVVHSFDIFCHLIRHSEFSLDFSILVILLLSHTCHNIFKFNTITLKPSFSFVVHLNTKYCTRKCIPCFLCTVYMFRINYEFLDNFSHIEIILVECLLITYTVKCTCLTYMCMYALCCVLMKKY